MKKFFVAIATFALALGLASAQDFKAAVDAFNTGAQALESNKTEALAQFRSALAQAKECTEEEAAELVANCKKIIPGTILSIAKEQINEGSYDQAIATLDEAKAAAAEFGAEEVAAEAGNLLPNVYLRKGSTLLKAKDMAGATEAFKSVVELDPENGQAYLLLGQGLAATGAIDEAIEAYEKAYGLGKEDQAGKQLSTTYLKKGQALLKAGKNDDAVAAFEKSTTYAENANAYKLMASAFTKGGKSAKAIDAYKKYLEVSPDAKDAADIIFTIAATAQKAGDKATAKEYYQKLSGTKYAEQAAAQLKTL